MTAYDRNGTVAGTATTDANGLYTLTTTASGLMGPYRLEFTNLPAGYTPSRNGTDNATGTQFVSAPAANINFGVARPSDYCQNNPTLLTPIFCNGNPSDASATGIESVMSTVYGSTAEASAATVEQTGALYGVAADKAQRRAILSAYVRRHVGLYESPLGTPKPGQLFTIPYNGTSATPFVDLASIGVNVGTVPSNVARDLSNVSTFSLDAGASGVYEEVGMVGLGDIDINANGDLWVVSLFDRQLYQIHLPTNGGTPTAADVSAKGVITAPCVAGSGVARPFGLRPRNGLIYLGVVCDGSINAGTNRANLDAYVITFKCGHRRVHDVLSFRLS